MELVFDEIKTHLNGRPVHLRSKTPRGVVQELYGLFLAHRIIRQVMSDAAQAEKLEPDRLSFMDTLRVLQNHFFEGTHVLSRPMVPTADRGSRPASPPSTPKPLVSACHSTQNQTLGQETPQTSELSATVKTLCGISSYSLIHGHWA